MKQISLLLIASCVTIFDGGCQESGNESNNVEVEDKVVETRTTPTVTGIHYAYSPLHLTYLAKLDAQVYQLLGKYEQVLLERLDMIQRYRWDYENSVLKSINSMPQGADEWGQFSFLVSHPMLVYRLLSRFGMDLKSLYGEVSKNVETEFLQTLESMKGSYSWPSTTDVGQTVKGLFRLQETYDISPIDFAEGQLGDYDTVVGATAKHCVEIAEVALSLGDTLTAGEWLKAAKHKMHYEEDESIDFDYLNMQWENAVRMHGKTWNIDDFHAPDNDVFYESKMLVRREHEEQKFNISYRNRIHNFKALCRGEIAPQLIRERTRGHCHLNFANPYFKINPQKIEVHSEDPLILEVHSFFGEKLIQDISDLIFDPLMEASEHRTGKEANFLLETKTTAPTWLHGSFPSVLNSFRKLEKIVGHPVLSEDEAEPLLYIQAFSVGNHYEPCLVCEEEIPQVLQKTGPRIATAEFVLDETEAGGDTVFIHLGLKIKPEKGSVLFFLDEGTQSQDFRRLRGSCPVLLGQKWIGSRFIYERGQCPSPKSQKLILQNQY